MNDKQRQNILDTIESYKKADFEASFKTKYKDTALIDSVVVGNYTISELFFYLEERSCSLRISWKIVTGE